MQTRSTRSLSIVAALVLGACGEKDAPVESAAAEAADAAAAEAAAQAAAEAKFIEETAAATLAAMDPSADPCTDFYRYACGGWLDTTERPADQASWTRSFSVINEENRKVLRELLEEAAADPGAGGDDPAAAGDWRRLGELYGSCMDEPAIEAAGLAPVQPILDDIDGLQDLDQLPALLGRLYAAGIGGLWDSEVWGDLKEPDTNMFYMSQGGLGLPDRDYYLRDDDNSVALQQAYRDYLARLLEMSGTPAEQARADAEAIYAFEHAIAEFSLPREALRDPNAIYNPVSADELPELGAHLDLVAWASAAGLPLDYPVSVHNLDWYRSLDGLLADTDVAVVRAWLRAHTLSSLADALPDAWGQLQFEFYGQKVIGQPQRKERWKRCVDSANGLLGEALGRHYVARRFAGDSKERALTMVHDIEEAFRNGLADLAWMDDETRAKAVEKADTLVEKIGYPDKWMDTSAMEISVQPYAANVLAGRRFHVARDLAKVGQPADPSEWYMPPAMVNAYYNPVENEMVFPAGILQPPFFHRAFPDAMNYGAIGMVIGHELTHGFDDEGRKFDKDGRLTEWWSEEVSARFEERARCVEEQYDGYEAVDGLHVNGKLTLGENIADLGGVKLAWNAYKAHEAATGGADPMVPELTDDQLFFVAFAQGWCTLMSPELEKLLVTSNPHSPPRYRVNGPLSNLPAFHQAFSCQAGDAMVREPACEVW
ncbi:MAG: M13 family peptidase [Deltaproteobacteria bacterium]|nr:MAG: M13 family peptidase [Deltaproteobacteria bacterium]